MLFQGGELLLHKFGLVSDNFLWVFRLNELLGVIERCLHIGFGEVERLRADVLGARLQGVCGAFRLRGCLLSGRDETFEGFAGLTTVFEVKSRISGGISYGILVMVCTFP